SNPPGGTARDSHAAVGRQTTLADAGNPLPGQLSLISSMITLANTNKVGLVVKGRVGGYPRGFAYVGSNNFQSDKVAEVYTAAALQALAAPGSELTYTVVPKGAETRIGIDRDLDGVLDSDPTPCPADFDGNGMVEITDIFQFLAAWFALDPSADWNGNTIYDIGDIFAYLASWFAGCH
ncbi:MAG: GC-type dockerin domain-anchored protein, partial [Gemmatimonadales bacterium]